MQIIKSLSLTVCCLFIGCLVLSVYANNGVTNIYKHVMGLKIISLPLKIIGPVIGIEL